MTSLLEFVESLLGDRWTTASALHRGEPGSATAIYDAASWGTRSGLRDVDVASRGPGDVHVQRRIEIGQIDETLAAGLTVCGDVSDHAAIGTCLDGLSALLDLPRAGAFAKAYVSPDGAGFPLHFDPYHVLVCQIEGRKRWRFGAHPVLESSLRGGKLDANGTAVGTGPHEDEPLLHDDGRPVQAPKREDLQEAVLRPGDLLYLPPGTWHAAQADGMSIAVSLSPARAPRLEGAARALVERLQRHPQWRRDGSAAGARPSLAQIADAIDDATLSRIWHAARAADEPTSRSREAAAPPRRAHVFRLVGPSPLRYSLGPSPLTGERVVFFWRGATELTLPEEALPFVQRMADGRVFRADALTDWVPGLAWEDARDLLVELLAAGVLEQIVA